MLLRIVSSSMRHRIGLYVPMLVTIVVSISLLGAAEVVGASFKQVVNQEMQKYGANVIIIPKENMAVNDGVPISVKNVKLGEAEVSVGTTRLADLLRINPAWVVRGEGSILVGQSVANQMGLTSGSTVEIDGIKGEVALLESGTEFDTFIMVEGEARNPSMILLRTDEPDKYKGENAIVFEEITKTKYSFLESIRKFMFYVAVISALASIAVIINLVRIDAGDRKKEFGIFSTLGALPQTIAKFVLTEFLVLSLLSAFFGILVSLFLSWIVLSFTARTSPVVPTGILPIIFLTSFAAFALASLLYVMEFKRHAVVQELRGE